jgi:hypothetical protein
MILGAKVMTSNQGGHSLEAVAEMCVDRLIAVADSAPPEIAEQARLARQSMLEVVHHYVKLAVQEDRRTLATKLQQAGLGDVAQHIRSL